MTISEFATRLGDTIKGAVKIICGSRGLVAVERADAERIVILGNGPSLRTTIEENGALLQSLPTMAVNFMANAPEFKLLRPRYYVLADPHFFTGLEHENVQQLWREIAAVDWEMTLFVPATRLAVARQLTASASKLKFASFNFVGVEGFEWFERAVYSSGLAMPRPRNVLIPALMCAIRLGFKVIDIVGADHSWLETIRVTDDNHVVSVQPHFYADSTKELTRSRSEYKGYRLHDILKSFYIAFSSYHRVKNYADGCGVKIYNCTPQSYIDAFERKKYRVKPLNTQKNH